MRKATSSTFRPAPSTPSCSQKSNSAATRHFVCLIVAGSANYTKTTGWPLPIHGRFNRQAIRRPLPRTGPSSLQASISFWSELNYRPLQARRCLPNRKQPTSRGQRAVRPSHREPASVLLLHGRLPPNRHWSWPDLDSGQCVAALSPKRALTAGCIAPSHHWSSVGGGIQRPSAIAPAVSRPLCRTLVVIHFIHNTVGSLRKV